MPRSDQTGFIFPWIFLWASLILLSRISSGNTDFFLTCEEMLLEQSLFRIPTMDNYRFIEIDGTKTKDTERKLPKSLWRITMGLAERSGFKFPRGTRITPLNKIGLSGLMQAFKLYPNFASRYAMKRESGGSLTLVGERGITQTIEGVSASDIELLNASDLDHDPHEVVIVRIRSIDEDGHQHDILQNRVHGANIEIDSTKVLFETGETIRVLNLAGFKVLSLDFIHSHPLAELIAYDENNQAHAFLSPLSEKDSFLGEHVSMMVPDVFIHITAVTPSHLKYRSSFFRGRAIR